MSTLPLTPLVFTLTHTGNEDAPDVYALTRKPEPPLERYKAYQVYLRGPNIITIARLLTLRAKDSAYAEVTLFLANRLTRCLLTLPLRALHRDHRDATLLSYTPPAETPPSLQTHCLWMLWASHSAARTTSDIVSESAGRLLLHPSSVLLIIVRFTPSQSPCPAVLL